MLYIRRITGGFVPRLQAQFLASQSLELRYFYI